MEETWFRSLTLSNVRSFSEAQTILFTKPNNKLAQWNIILGENGTGKTTILKCLALLLYFKRGNYELKNYIDPRYFIRDSNSLPLIKQVFDTKTEYSDITSNLYFHIQEGEINFSDNENNGLNLFHPDRALKHIFGYGASRRVGETGISSKQESDVASLFNENAFLVNAEEWLILSDYQSLKHGDVSRGRFSMVKDLLLKLLKGEVKDIEIVDTDPNSSRPKAMFLTNYGWVGLHDLSLGHKTLIAWMIDFAKGLFDHYTNSSNPLEESAICLVDEIDLHLHPKLQSSLLSFLSSIFKKTQFIVTAHSPLIVQSAHQDANIILLSRSADHTEINNDPEIVNTWRIDQLLTSDLFGLKTTQRPDIQKKISRRRNLLSKTQRSIQEENELESLELQLDEIPILESEEALKAIELIKKAALKLPNQ